MKETRVAIYARVSTEHQVEEETIASQQRELCVQIEQDGFELVPELAFIDDGCSGATLLRPSLERLRDVAALQGIDRLYVHSPDRLARKYAYQVLLMDELTRAGVEVIFLNRPIGQTPEDDLLLQVQGMVAEYERTKIMERSRRGKRHAAEQGNVAVLSGAPYGYRYVSKQAGGGQARYEIHLGEAEVVRQIFQWVGQEGVTLNEVSRRLSAAGEPTRTGKARWSRSVIGRMLKNPAYKGMAAYGKTKVTPLRPQLRPRRGAPAVPKHPVAKASVAEDAWLYIPVPALVDADLFAVVQEQLETNRQRARQSRQGARYLLQGLLVCRQCGYAYYAKPGNKRKSGQREMPRYVYNRCSGTDTARFGGERVCDNLPVRTDLLEQVVWEEVCALLGDPQRLAAEFERRLEATPAENADLKAIAAQTAKIRRGIARLIDAYAEGLIEKQEFEPRLHRLRQRQSDLEEKEKTVATRMAQQTELRTVITRLEEFAAKVQNGLASADWNTKRNLIRTLVQRIEIGRDDVNVVFRIASVPFDLSPEGHLAQYCPNCNGGRTQDATSWETGNR